MSALEKLGEQWFGGAAQDDDKRSLFSVQTVRVPGLIDEALKLAGMVLMKVANTTDGKNIGCCNVRVERVARKLSG